MEAVSCKYSSPFREPFDYVAAKATDYPQLIKKPMDLHTILDKTKSSAYASLDDVGQDVYQILDNSITYNGPEHLVSIAAEALYIWFIERLKDKSLLVIPSPPQVQSTVQSTVQWNDVVRVKFRSTEGSERDTHIFVIDPRLPDPFGTFMKLYCGNTGKDRRTLIFWHKATRQMLWGNVHLLSKPSARASRTHVLVYRSSKRIKRARKY